jgi:hypothetical protein
MKTSMKLRLGSVCLALSAVFASAQAAPDYTATVLIDTVDHVLVNWTWNSSQATAFTSLLTAPDLAFWELAASGLTDGNTYKVGVSGQHVVEPHPPVDVARAPVFVAGADIALGGAYSYSAMARHYPNSVFSSPADGVTPHWDHYWLTVDASAADKVSITLEGIHPVPEPSTYAMLLAGLALLGVGCYRSRRDEPFKS